jgi:two-component system, chemotaxis family, protein-glutamate methylesterase/glutaminase
MNNLIHQPIIVIGASAGGVNAILELALTLPRNFPAPILFVQHIGAHTSALSNLVSASGTNRAITACDGDVPRAGTIHIAPPDHHMLLDGSVIRLSRGPKEHHTRPAIDPLFRSAALECGPRAIGVILTGMLDDGSAGLRAIKECGGMAVVQDPADAHAPSMPRCALASVEADHVVPLASMGSLLYRLARKRLAPSKVFHTPAALEREHQISSGACVVQDLQDIASPSTFSCPDCGGVLFEFNDKRLVRYRCHTGHAFSLRSLACTQDEVTHAALCSSLRALREKESILRRLAQVQGPQTSEPAQAALREADELAEVCTVLRKLTEKVAPAQRIDATP